MARIAAHPPRRIAMSRSPVRLLPVLLAALGLGGCPARVGGPPPVGDFAVSGDLSVVRFDLSVPDLSPGADLASGADLAKPAGDASTMDAAKTMDLPAPIDAPIADGSLLDLGTLDGGSPDVAMGADGGPPDLARADGAADDLATLPDLACLPLASCTNARGFVNGNDIGLQANVAVNAVANQTVTITAWTTPSGANPGVHAIFATNGQFMNSQDLPFTFDARPQGNPPPNGTD